MSRQRGKKGTVDLENDKQSPDLYSEFGLSKTVSEAEIKKAYRTLALKYHPDKLSALSTDAEKQAATAKFQQIATWYSVLSDPVKRKRYDATGEIESGGTTMFSAKGDATWEEYFKTLWGEVNEASIDKFSKEYRESDEERTDVLKAYKSCKGHIFNIIDRVMLATLDDIPRFITIIQSSIDAKEVPLYPLFTETSQDKKELARRKKKAERETKEAEKALKSREKKQKGGNEKGMGKGSGGEDELRALMMSRQTGRLESLIAGLEEKYVGKKNKGQEKGSKRRKIEDLVEGEDQDDMDGDSEEGDWEDLDDEDEDGGDEDRDEEDGEDEDGGDEDRDEEDGEDGPEVPAPKASAAKKQTTNGNPGKASATSAGKRKR